MLECLAVGCQHPQTQVLLRGPLPDTTRPCRKRARSTDSEGALLRSEAQLEHTVWHSHGDRCCWQ